MLAIGMVASFLTGNLTVGFVLGALFNVPLAFASSADVIIWIRMPGRRRSSDGASPISSAIFRAA